MNPNPSPALRTSALNVERSALSVLPSRRSFLRRAGLATSATLLAQLGVKPAAAQSSSRASSGPSYPKSKDTNDDLAFMSATKLAGLIRDKKVSAVEAVTANYARIDAVNPKLNAVVQFCRERAFAEAKAADQALASGKLLGPLHGVPMTIKDSIDTAGVISTAGTVGRMSFIPEKDATTVARLRAAGAILLGKTNTPEWTLAGGGIPGVSTTANIVYGITKNPYDTTRSTAGSSGGAGAIVAAGGSAFDIGTDWGGSIRGPAHNNGIAGIKPTFGRVPRTGHIVGFGGYLDNWQELGPMARRVEDLQLLMPIVAGPDFTDCAQYPMPWKTDPVDIAKLRVAFFPTNGVAETTQETQDMVRTCAKYFSDAGAKVTEDCPKDIIMELEEIRVKFMAGCGWSYLERLAEKWGSKAVSPTVVARYKQGVVPTAELIELWEKQDANKVKFLHWIKDYDIVLCPTAGKPAQPINLGVTPGGFRPGSGYTGMFNTTGYPSAVVRAGTSPEKLPLGIMVTGQPWRDETVLAACDFIEAKTGGWQRPAI
jgi:amidase